MKKTIVMAISRKPNKPGTRLVRQLAGVEKHLERHPRDSLSRQRVATIKHLMSGGK